MCFPLYKGIIIIIIIIVVISVAPHLTGQGEHTAHYKTDTNVCRKRKQNNNKSNKTKNI